MVAARSPKRFRAASKIGSGSTPIGHALPRRSETRSSVVQLLTGRAITQVYTFHNFDWERSPPPPLSGETHAFRDEPCDPREAPKRTTEFGDRDHWRNQRRKDLRQAVSGSVSLGPAPQPPEIGRVSASALPDPRKRVEPRTGWRRVQARATTSLVSIPGSTRKQQGSRPKPGIQDQPRCPNPGLILAPQGWSAND